MTDKYDAAVVNLFADKLEVDPETITDITFGYWLGCYSSWTCDYSVEATVTYTDGSTVKTDVTWSVALEQVGEYVEALDAMYEEHDESHRGEE